VRPCFQGGLTPLSPAQQRLLTLRGKFLFNPHSYQRGVTEAFLLRDYFKFFDFIWLKPKSDLRFSWTNKSSLSFFGIFCKLREIMRFPKLSH